MTGLRLTPDELESLVASHDDLVAHDHADALAAIASPVAQLRLWVAAQDRASLHQVWCAGGVSAVLLHVRDDTYELHTVATTFVPALLARVTRIGPRRTRAGSPVAVSDGWVESVMESDTSGRSAAWDELLEAGAAEDGALSSAVRDGSAWTWVLDCVWPAPGDQAGRRRVAVVDGRAGTWIHDGDRLTPASAREVWRVLTRMLPDDDELEARVVDAG